MTRRNQNADMDTGNYDVNFPAISFELTGVRFAPQRHTNPLQRIDNPTSNDNIRSYNRVPYDLSFSVWVGTKRFEDSLQIIEQTLPNFTPELTMTIKDREEFNLDSNISIVLNNVSVNVTYEGAFTDRRIIEWHLELTTKAYYYAPIETRKRIKHALVDLRQKDFDARFEAYTSEVSPRTANREDQHNIINTVIEGTMK